MSWKKALSILVLLFWSVIFGVYGGSIFFRTTSEPQPIKLILPERVDLRSSREVNVGTFSVTISLMELLARAEKSDQTVLATYQEIPEQIRLHYYLPRVDMLGTFFYAVEDYPYTESLKESYIIRHKGKSLVVFSQQNYGLAIIMCGFSLLWFFFATVIWFDRIWLY